VIILVLGPDAATARTEVERLRLAHDPDGLNTVRLDGKSLSIEEAVAAASASAFFGGSRVVIIEGLMARLGRGGGSSVGEDREERATSAKGFDIARLFASVPEPNVLILTDPSLTSVPAAVKKAAPKTTQIVTGEPPRGDKLLAWLQDVANQAGSEIERSAAALLAEMKFPRVWRDKPSNPAYDRPPDLDELRNEVEKLVLAAHPGPIRQEHVRAMVAPTTDDRVFPFLDAAMTGRLREAVKELGALHVAGEDPARIAAQLFQEIELSVVAAAGRYVDAEIVGREIGLSNPRRMASVSRRLRDVRQSPSEMVMSAVEIERRSKRGMLRQPIDVLHSLVTAAGANTTRGDR